jgi:acyl-CoA thioester hydrolase
MTIENTNKVKALPELKDFYTEYAITTRWLDNDQFGHINNVNYYSFFDTIVNQFLITEAGYSPTQSGKIGLMVESNCRYFKSLAYPDKLFGGFRVKRLGNSSVTYEVGIFKQNEESLCALGTLTHVFVGREDSKPTPIPEDLRAALTKALST